MKVREPHPHDDLKNEAHDVVEALRRVVIHESSVVLEVPALGNVGFVGRLPGLECKGGSQAQVKNSFIFALDNNQVDN